MGSQIIGTNNASSSLETALMQDLDHRLEQGKDGQTVQQEMALLTSLMNHSNRGQGRPPSGTPGQPSQPLHHRHHHSHGNPTSKLETALEKALTSEIQDGEAGSRTARTEMKLLTDLLNQGIPPGCGEKGCGGGEPWTAQNAGNGTASIDLGNYTLNLNKANSGLTLTDKATGAVTAISGDPHVSEAGQTWTFKDSTTFQLADGTSLTIKTVPYGNGQTLSNEIDITNGNQSMRITGLAQNNTSPIQITQGYSGQQLAASNRTDPVIYESGIQWTSRGGQVVNQLYATEVLS